MEQQQQVTGISKEQEMFALIAELESCDMSVKDFCELYDMAQGTYYYWQKKYHASREESKGKEAQSSFTLLEVSDLEQEVVEEGLLAEYKGVKFYREPSVSFLKALIN